MPVTHEDLPHIRALEAEPQVHLRWRDGAQTLSPNSFVRVITDGVLDRRVVRLERGKEVDGIVTAFGANLRNGTASLGIVMRSGLHSTGAGMVACGLFIDVLFDEWPLRKLYAEIAEYNVSQFRSAIDKFCVEAVLRGHIERQGRTWDSLVLAIDRETWVEAYRPLIRRS
jgi:RimJ/RimL family protein N-acetyltransferase